MIHLSCPNCRARLKADHSALGKRAKCPKCGGSVPVQDSLGSLVPLGQEVDTAADDARQVIIFVTPPYMPLVPVADDDEPAKKPRWPLLASLAIVGVLVAGSGVALFLARPKENVSHCQRSGVRRRQCAPVGFHFGD